ncbi:ABC transporter ATP-binding protein [Ornithinimicrobium faecis]|uniref:ABC transporter ATP-binding protein n=1 Tax=Ornithinimicrobium faecis TaxID=2934158 RepID=A0ABY4YWX1_9MICO|nr:ABC transporter ATP-binding protein [Ornithinimicrobium sp. HY1793]USQ81279.1 ABC transporter ATP-binding protein [Ornithinimicrobium sp. HY1793]
MSRTTLGSSRGRGARLLTVSGLTVQTRAGTTLVGDVSLELNRGETVGIVGESGSGKSLTARAITGLLPRELRASGEAELDGIQLIGVPESRLRTIRGRRVSLLMQDPFTMLNPLQKAATHIVESLPAGTAARRGMKAEVERRLAEVGLAADVAERYPFQLSGGMRQRLALAAALAGDPELLIADEPTTALDVTTQSEILQLLARIQEQRHMALVLITHDLGVAFSVCDRIHVMYAGSMVEVGAAATLAESPGHPYTVGLRLAEPPFGHYAPQLSAIPGRVPSPDAVSTQCAFAARCTWAQDECRAGRPSLRLIEDARQSACVRIADIRHDLQAAIGASQATGEPPAVAGEEPLLVVEDLQKSFKTSPMLGRSLTVPALKGVSFELGVGESLGLVGETGSGKSTIARLILGLASGDAGRINLGGLDLTSYRRLSSGDRREARRKVQMVFQDPYSSLNPARTVGSVLSEVLRTAGRDGESRDGVADLLVQVGLPTDYASRLPAGLSGGERQRVAIARALAVRPELLICDEPVAALDVSAQAQVLELLRELRARHRMALLFITHDLAVVRQVAERLIVLRHGEVVEAGPVGDVLEAPQHPYTQKLVQAVRDTRERLEPGNEGAA